MGTTSKAPPAGKRARYGAALILAVLAGMRVGPSAPTAHAQDLPEPGEGFTWERVGDAPINARDLAFGPDSTLWAASPWGVFRLDTTGGAPGAWVLFDEERALDAILVLGRGPKGDTLVVGTGGSTLRSTDGGHTWAEVHDEGEEGLYEVPAGYPFAGTVLTGDLEAIAYSTDRAASFTPSVVPSPDGNTAGADDFVALPPGSSHPGRILAAGRWGVNISDDGGATFRESGLWQAAYYFGEAVDVVERMALVEGPGGVGAVMGGRVSGQSLARVWASADDGETWLPDGGGHQLLEGPPNSGSPRAVLALGGSSVLAVLRGGTVYRSDDAGQAWAPVGRAPEISTFITASSAVLGPDRRLYVGLLEIGADGEGWVYRTSETHLPVASEPSPVPEEALGLEVSPNPFRGEAEVTLTLSRPSEVEAALYDVLGRRVAVLASGLLPAGRHELPLDAGRLAPGVYVVRVEAGGAVATQTVTVLR